MSKAEIKKYIKILKNKGKALIAELENIDVTSPNFRDVVINFNNVFTNIQQYTLLLEELEDEENKEISSDVA